MDSRAQPTGRIDSVLAAQRISRMAAGAASFGFDILQILCSTFARALHIPPGDVASLLKPLNGRMPRNQH
eukprot:4790088-Pyramimonas_sp.AAC.1